MRNKKGSGFVLMLLIAVLTSSMLAFHHHVTSNRDLILETEKASRYFRTPVDSDLLPNIYRVIAPESINILPAIIDD